LHDRGNLIRKHADGKQVSARRHAVHAEPSVVARAIGHADRGANVKHAVHLLPAQQRHLDVHDLGPQ
jgi:hypothetical protein